MDSMADYFKPVDPFSMQPDWVRKDFPELGYSLSLRPVYIPDDLRTLHRWIQDFDEKINTIESGDQGRLLRHYKRILFSSWGQSFVVLSGKEIVCQFDLKGTGRDPLYFLIPTKVNDCVLTCLIPARSLTSKIWIAGLTLLLELFFNLSGSGYIFVSAPQYPHVFIHGLEELGFKTYGEMEGMNQPTILLFRANGIE